MLDDGAEGGEGAAVGGGDGGGRGGMGDVRGRLGVDLELEADLDYVQWCDAES